MRFARYALLVVATVGLVGSLTYVISTPTTPRPMDGEVVLVADRLDGSVMEFEEVAGEILIIDFWATWCGPCVTEIPHYNSIDEDYRDAGVHLLGITVQSGTPEEVVEWAAGDEHRTAITYPLVMANDDLFNFYGPIFGYPTTILIGKDGAEVKRWIGATVNKSEEIRELLDEMLATDPTP